MEQLWFKAKRSRKRVHFIKKARKPVSIEDIVTWVIISKTDDEIKNTRGQKLLILVHIKGKSSIMGGSFEKTAEWKTKNCELGSLNRWISLCKILKLTRNNSVYHEVSSIKNYK